MRSQEEELHMAIRENNKVECERLVTGQRVNLNCVYYGMTPVLVAVSSGHVEMATWLIDQGCDITIQDVQGTTVLEEAVNRDQVTVVKKLSSAGADVNQHLTGGHTPLTHAAQQKHTYMVQCLIECGADVNLANRKGDTPMFIAAREGYQGIVESLVKGAADLNQPCGKESLTPLIAATANGHLKVLNLLCKESLTPLIAATANGHLKVLNLLCKARCDTEARDGGGWTALWHAVSDSNDSLTRALVAAGADIHVTDSDGRTLRQEAADNEMDDITDILNKAK